MSADIARAETYIVLSHRMIKGDGAIECDTLGGRYVDRFEKRGGEWRIDHRVRHPAGIKSGTPIKKLSASCISVLTAQNINPRTIVIQTGIGQRVIIDTPQLVKE